MAQRYELLVFDWDGTLIDSTAFIANCIQAAAEDLGLPVPDFATASHVIGLGLKDALAYAVPQLREVDFPRMTERYSHHFRARDGEVPLFEGTLEMLEELEGRGHLLAIATGKSTKGLERALLATSTTRFFAATRCADQCSPKPAPDMLHELMDTFGMPAESTLMIGDTTHDLRMAAYAGVSSLAVTHGAHARESLLKFDPLACLANTRELAQWLKQNA